MDGIIIINKPKDMTSNNVVNKVKHILNCKVGHTGTLDPNATGVLPLLLGDGTKFSKYLINHDKKYRATLKLGIKMSTADVEGDVIEEKEVDKSIFDKDKLKEVLNSFTGKQTQTPPIYSAIKVKGKKLYDYARRGIDVEIPIREIEIYEMELIGYDDTCNMVTFEVACSKGTYIRSLCEDIAEKLNTVGYMLDLERLMVGDFYIENSVLIGELEENVNNLNWIEKHIISIENLMDKYPRLDLPTKKLEPFLNGVKLSAENHEDGVYKVYCDSRFLGSCIVADAKVKRDIILNNAWKHAIISMEIYTEEGEEYVFNCWARKPRSRICKNKT